MIKIFFADQDIFVDRVSFGGKTLFVFRHDIARVHDRVMMQVIRDRADFKSTLRGFFHSKIKQDPVIGLEFDGPAFRQDCVIFLQEGPGREPAAGMPFLGPGIGEIKIDFSYFSFREIIGQKFRVAPDKAEVGQL